MSSLFLAQNLLSNLLYNPKVFWLAFFLILSYVINGQWMSLVITLGDIQEELDGVLCWIAALLILLLQWLYPGVPQSHVLSRIFYDHLTLSRDLTYWVPTLFISLLYCMLWGFGLSIQMCGKPFSFWGSHNTLSKTLSHLWNFYSTIFLTFSLFSSTSLSNFSSIVYFYSFLSA